MCELYPFTDGETEAQADKNPMQEFVPMGEAEGVFPWRFLFGRGQGSIMIFKWLGLPLACSLLTGPLLAGCSASYTLWPLLALATLLSTAGSQVHPA